MDGRRFIQALLAIYVATLSLPALGLLGWVAVAAATPPTIIATGLIIAVGTAVAANRIADLPARAASVRIAAVTILPPLAYLPSLLFGESSPDEWLAIVGLLAVVPGMFVPIAGAVIRNKRLRERATEHVVVTVGDDDDSDDALFSRNSSLGVAISTWRRRGAAVAIVGATIAVAASLIALIDGDGSDTVLLTSLTGLSSLSMLFTDDSTELAVTDAGLRVERSMTPWDDLGGFRVTDDAIEIERTRWWLPSRDFDRDEIGDDAAFIDALDEYLPRTDEKTTPAATTASR